MTPVTPLTVEGLTSLHDLIKQELDEPGKERIQRHVRKLVSAAKISLAKQTLFQDQNQFLSRINSETKVRRSTKSVILGKAKVMSYEDLEEARAKRATTETARAGKAKRRTKRKTSEAETEVEAAPLGAVTDLLIEKVRVQETGPVNSSMLWRAPITYMY